MKVIRLLVCCTIMGCSMLTAQPTLARQYAAQQYYYHHYGDQAANSSYYQRPSYHVAPPAARVSARDIIRRGTDGQPEGYVPRTLDQAIRTPKNAREAESLRRRAEEFLNQRRRRQLESTNRPPTSQRRSLTDPTRLPQPQNKAQANQVPLSQPTISPFADPPGPSSVQVPPALLNGPQLHSPKKQIPAIPVQHPSPTELQTPQQEILREPAAQPTPQLNESPHRSIESQSIKFSRTKPQEIDSQPTPGEPVNAPELEQPAPNDIHLAPQNQQPQSIVEPLSIEQPPELSSPPPQPVQQQPTQSEVTPGVAAPQQFFEPAYQPIPGLPPESTPATQIPSPSDTLSRHQHQSNQVYNNIVIPGGSCTQCGNHKSKERSSHCRSCRADCQTSGCPEYYLSFFGGHTNLRDLESQSGIAEIIAEEGSGFGAALGRRQTRNLRTEFEFSFRQNDLSGFQTGSVFQPIDGELNSFAGMVNAYWEFIDVPSRYFKPYIGAGVGFVGFDVDANVPGGPSLITAGTDGDTSFAYQWIAGINYKAYRNVDVFAEYRFFAADSFQLDSASTAFSGPFDYETENVFFGFRWKF